MKKLIAFGLAALMVTGSLFAAPWSKKSKKAKGPTIGVSMPTKDLQRWNQDGDNMKKKLEKAGYAVDLQYANNDIATQTSQIENMITKGDKVLVIAAIDGSALKNVLDSAKKKGIKVIAYDRLIMNSDAVSYYATFDNYKVGTIQGDFLVDKLNLKSRSASDPAYIELFTGSPDDNNINFFFGGAMDVLKPYIDSGVLVVPSGQTAKAQCATLNWSTEEAQKRMENLITSQGYGPRGKRLDAVYSSNDSCAMGITNALVAAGYTASNFPLITGQDCDKPSVKNMLKGTQAMSIFKDTRTLAEKVVGMVDAIMQGREPEINDTKTYNNGTGIIPSYLCDPVFATVDNYKALLIDSGYYKESELK
ncbi:MAG: sugar-binding protein [Treponema sp.]|nr:sugar-binding protein [Treponema sp.]